MLRKLLSCANFYTGSALTLVYSVIELKRLVKRLAETEQVNSAHQYVAVRFTRGDYNSWKGIDQMYYDYKFYRTISKFND